MKKYDVAVIGSGCGLLVVEAAARKGLKVALFEEGNMGGTCLNVGCIPSKMLIYPADVIYEIERSYRIGISAACSSVDFESIIQRTLSTVTGYRNKLQRQMHRVEGIDLYEQHARFVDDSTIEAGGERIQARQVFIACGARPSIPANFSVKEGYLTNDNLLELKTLPGQITIIGGGYIACEYAHFFASMGSDVTILEMADRLLLSEEPEISAVVEKTLGDKIKVLTGIHVSSVDKTASGWVVNAIDANQNLEKQVMSERVLYAVGRTSNTDGLNLESTGIKTDDKGFITVDEYLQTSVDNIYAIGDVNGQYMFRHAANYEAEIAWHNSQTGSGEHKKVPVDYSAMPKAIFTRPQVASVGMTEEHARKAHNIKTGTVSYFDTAKGEAMQEKDGFAKTIIEAESGAILGFHIVGPSAAILIQEVVNAMTYDQTGASIAGSVHIHPALSEIIPLALSSPR